MPKAKGGVLPDGKHADTLIDTPGRVRGSPTWDQGTGMARHAALTLATTMAVYFAYPHSPWERSTGENTNGVIREYPPEAPRSPALHDAIADELNDRPRAALGYHTPRRMYQRLLTKTLLPRVDTAFQKRVLEGPPVWLRLHTVATNDATQVTPLWPASLSRNLCMPMRSTPTSGSWLNLVEISLAPSPARQSAAPR